MYRIPILIVCALVVSGCRTYVQNPDPNHTHADFAVWVNGEQLDFSAEELMSDEAHLDPYLHLHDGIGTLIHRHKPGLTVGDFFASIGFSVASQKQGEWCWHTLLAEHPFVDCESGPIRLFVNGVELTNPDGPFTYVFEDLDKLLLTDATDPVMITVQQAALEDDACLYSKRCPWRGEPPAENCVADPAVPCTE